MARFKIAFWLDADKDDELLLLETIDELKAARQFTRAVRDGLRLFVSLSKGETDVLESLFPAVVARLRGEGNTDTGGGGGQSEHLARIESLLLQLQTPGGIVAAAREPQPAAIAGNTGGPKPMTTGAAPPPPVYDDDDADLITVKKSEGGGRQANENFLAAMRRLQNM